MLAISSELFYGVLSRDCVFYMSSSHTGGALLSVFMFCPVSISPRDVTDSESASESDEIRHFFGNPKFDRFLKSDHDGVTNLEIFLSVHV